MCGSANFGERYSKVPTEASVRIGGCALDLFVNAGPVPLHGMVSVCQSANSALIFVRLLCVPPVAVPPGLLVAAKTVIP